MHVKIVQGLFIALLAGALSVGSLLASSALKWAQELPSLEALDALEFSTTSQVFANDGTTRIGVLVPAMGEDRDPPTAFRHPRPGLARCAAGHRGVRG